jgi:hypothetical protein
MSKIMLLCNVILLLVSFTNNSAGSVDSTLVVIPNELIQFEWDDKMGSTLVSQMEKIPSSGEKTTQILISPFAFGMIGILCLIIYRKI